MGPSTVETIAPVPEKI